MSTLSCDVLTDAASLITRGHDGSCSFLFLTHPRPHVHLFLHKHKQRTVYVWASGPGARPLTQRPKFSDLQVTRKRSTPLTPVPPGGSSDGMNIQMSSHLFGWRWRGLVEDISSNRWTTRTHLLVRQVNAQWCIAKRFSFQGSPASS